MPQAQSPLLSKLMGQELAKAHNAVKDAIPAPDTGGSLPDGIENGIAQLADLRIGIYKTGPNQGKPFFYAAGVVKMPRDINGIPIEGLRTQIGPEPLCATPQAAGKRKTFTDHYNFMLDELKMLGAAEAIKNLSGTPEQIEQGLMNIMAVLKKQQPHFRFRTWKGKKQTTGPYANQEPRVQQVWQGVVDFSANGHVEAVQESVTEEPPTEEAGPDEPADDTGSEIDFDDLLTKAAAGDIAAQQALVDAGLAAGLSQEQVDATTWEELIELVKAAQNADPDVLGDEAPAEEVADEPKPEKGDVFMLMLLDKAGKPLVGKNKKPLPAVKVEIISVDEETQTATVKNTQDKKTLYKGVKWERLTPA